ncbi:peptide ABC transporter permease [Candidatus Epulonipiscium fishelsonii]|uniref:Peptide ABC transporter permease n=1 Tax=Candidatus Epulonipiscium fishelsonii TaxID=77094 RepID=A0ACC8XB02_9FIRM|nr:peptide ABC transporter permease [Epulopiscium sp. SCG-B05WGA-EpuloA1]ONI39457.1 peptide ABC transporter permease [Epulopiscium sp. SCG-B11WGA-EpuloA1]
MFKENSFYDLAFKRYKRNKLAIIGTVIVFLFILLAIFADFIAPYGYSDIFENAQTGLYDKYATPSRDHILGTDEIGRDIFSRLIYGARITMMVSICAVSISTIIGLIVGLVSGYFGGIIDKILMRLVDIVISFPVLFLLISISTILEPSIWIVICAIGFVTWTSTARLVRGEVLRVKQLDYIMAAKSLGTPTFKVVTKHVLMNILAPIMVQVTIATSQAILMEASLSFLGVGVQRPMPSWGNMLIDAQKTIVIRDMPWVWIPPGILTLLLVLGIYFVGDGLRDAFDSKQ